ncbi:ArnT family glycosyltransferase [Nocardia sp. alder85J]|uniref:ArnT family glycosyltransferase n=1 Tax=Nocardia sp. alder85J TaxID=2862949 RepID=UPI001CD45072|nr:glycosyltransferase family 39 protein [Nocardia sp. alder85J]MCX4093760.1 glycosyltransferase family 39 protein [Nocardia sp. alder85J]
MTALATPRATGGIRWQFWRSPDDQPRWARPALLLVATVAAVSYAWGITRLVPHVYYAAAVRSMASSWHDFFFAAFDPDGLISLDKLPGAFWLQALSVRLFGVHVWALALPQVIEGVLTVLVLYRVVRRTAGPAAGLLAAVVTAAAPVTVALDRGNISDTLLILLLVLAVDRTLAAIERNDPRNLWYAGLFVGLAFQAKMIQAWLIVPVLALAYLVSRIGVRPLRRVAAIAGFGAGTLVVSLSWMTVVSLIPARHRPYVDGSTHDSLFDQVFVYNGAARTDSGFSVGAANLPMSPGGASYRTALVLGPDDRLGHVLTGAGGRETGWLIPLALLILVVLAVLLRRRARSATAPDPVTAVPQRAALILWGGWLLVYLAVFLVVGTVNPYYLAVLTPPVAALIGWGTVEFARRSESAWRVGAVLAALATVAYGWWLLQPAPAAVRWTATAAALLACLLAVGLRGVAAAVLLAAAVLAGPAVAAASVVADGYSALDTPFEPAAQAHVTHDVVRDAIDSGPKLVASAHKTFPAAHIPAVAYTSIIAAPFIYSTGAEVPPVGGFTGMAQALTTADLARLVAHGDIGFALITPSDDPRIHWIQQHCGRLPGDENSVSAYMCAHP